METTFIRVFREIRGLIPMGNLRGWRRTWAFVVPINTSSGALFPCFLIGIGHCKMTIANCKLKAVFANLQFAMLNSQFEIASARLQPAKSYDLLPALVSPPDCRQNERQNRPLPLACEFP